MKKGLLIMVMGLIAGSVICAQDSEIVIDEEELFGDSEVIEEGDTSRDGGGEEDLFEEDAMFEDTILVDMTEEAGEKEVENLLVSSERADIGGRISISTLTTGDTSDLKDNSTEVELDTDLFLDARPAEDFRMFFKGNISYPFDTDDEREASDIFSVKELFSDFQLKDTVFFRAGKQTVSWGVGYFFSPADIINLTRIDPEDPEEERTGPVSLKTHVPFGLHNGYLYLILDDFADQKMPGIAPKAEFLLGSLELGIGGYYLYDSPPGGMITFTLPWKDFSFFGELYGSYGSDKVFIEESEDFLTYPPGWSPVRKEDIFFFSSTAGFRYSYVDEDSRFNISLAGQYYYNGEGYEDPSVITNNARAIGYLVGTEEIGGADLLEPSRHYGAASFNWNELLNTDFALSMFWIGSFADASGRFSGSISYALNDYLSCSLGANQSYGGDGDEFTPEGSRTTLTLGATLGSGRF